MNILSSNSTKVLVSFEQGEDIPPTYRHFDGSRNRMFVLRVCECGQHFYARKNRCNTYCSPDCRLSINRFTFNCDYCGKENTRALSKADNSRNEMYYCDRECKENDQRIDTGPSDIQPSHYGNGYYSYRARAFHEFGTVCNRCGYDELEKMLDVHHIDGNRSNSALDNLEVLCVWCHALETRKDWK